MNSQIIVTRRKIAALIGLAILEPMSGCVDFPAHREISIGEISTTQIESGWNLELTVTNDNTINTKDANFHDVKVHVYSQDRAEIAEQTVGELTHKHNVNDGKDVTVECQHFPYVVTFSADESPCEKNTTIMIGIYDGKQEGDFIWKTDYRECNEGLPPKFSTTQSLP